MTVEALDAYEFALARPDVLKYLPCYCGCVRVHTSELDCFIEGAKADGTTRFDKHGVFCDICLEIARDAERLLGEGKTLSEIRVLHRPGLSGEDTRNRHAMATSVA